MISYTIRYKKLTDTTTNNYRKLHGIPMKRWRHIVKFRDNQITKADRRRNERLDKFISGLGVDLLPYQKEFIIKAVTCENKVYVTFPPRLGYTHSMMLLSNLMLEGGKI